MRHSSKKFSKLILVLSLVLIVSLMLVPAAYAAGGSIVVLFETEDGPVVDNIINIYRIGWWTSGGGIYPLSDYSDIASNVYWEDVDVLAATIEQLEARIAEKAIAPTQTQTTNEKGRVDFDNLSDGAYLITASAFSTEDYTYTPVSSMVFLYEGNSYEFVELKFDREKIPEPEPEPDPDPQPEPEPKISVQVQKVWKDGDATKRPTEVRAVLMCNGEAYDVQVLNEANQWSYTWSDLSEMETWTVTEETVPEGYELSVTHDGNSWTLTNLKPEDHIIQTGLLRWPITVLCVAGISFILIGILLRKKRTSR